MYFRRGYGMEIVSYGRKFVIFWVGLIEMLDDFFFSLLLFEVFFFEIWCVVVLFERCYDDEIWG